MCGIAGLSLRQSNAEPSILQRMLARLGHRGPDDHGLYTDRGTGLAQSRLSIIDLTGGHQPLFARDGELALVANGEIYNHVELRDDLARRGHHFATRSDSETILHAYAEHGDGFLEPLCGMFAFALYDRKTERLVLARDRLGIKPLFIAHLPDGIAFASELKALLPLLDHAPEIDPAGLAQYLQNQFSSGPTTLIRGIERIAPGEALTIERGRIVQRRRYWTPLDAAPRELDYEEAAAEFDGLMDTVMRQHMRTDVPFGLFLSGGVDSGVLLALLSRYHTEPIRTFSVGFEGTRITDELPLARTLAEQFGSRHSEIRPSPKDLLHAFPLVTWAADELMRDHANLPTALLAQAAGQELKVVFSGEGGDEVFAGYGRYRSSPLERWAKALLAPGTGGFRTRGTFRGRWPRRLFQPDLQAANRHARAPFVHAWQATPRHWPALTRMQAVDLTTALPDNLMVKADRLLMAASLEGRVPFLDHRVVEFGLGLPPHLKVEKSQGKAFLKHWASRFLPTSHLYAKKRGFHVPMGDFFREDFVTRLHQTLPHNTAIRAWFRSEGVQHLLAQYGKNSVANRMTWALLQFAIWHRLFIEGDGERPAPQQDPLELIA